MAKVKKHFPIIQMELKASALGILFERNFVESLDCKPEPILVLLNSSMQEDA